MHKTTIVTVAALALAAGLAGCASTAPPPDYDKLALDTINASFRDQGIAKTSRLKQDEGQQACSSDKPPPPDVARRIEGDAQASVKWPADGVFLGDWRAGEKLAQNGRGMTWTDASAAPAANGGSCYNCHQIDKAEISFGTIGPSLYNYGKLRGVRDPASPESAAIVRYTWSKLWNSKANSACSNMPRFGHLGLLDDKQLRHLMALLLDPKSPVNQ
jgi:L-cysteine S-thiosulfotransferase